MEIRDVIDKLADAAEALLPMIGGPKGEAAVEIAKGLIGLGETVREVLSEDDAAALTPSLLALQARVTAKANETARGLRGGE